MDKITLKRKINGEYAPRYYTMTGGEFDEMLQAVKALGFRRFESMPIKAWLIKRDGLEALKKNYTVEQDDDFRTAEFVESTIKDYGDELTVTVYFEIRDIDGGWRHGPSRHIVSALTDEMIEAEKSRIDEATRTHFPNIKVSPCDRYRAVRAIARRAVEEYGATVVAAFNEATQGKRTLEAFQAGADAVKKMME